jgi:hypothetical protein
MVHSSTMESADAFDDVAVGLDWRDDVVVLAAVVGFAVGIDDGVGLAEVVALRWSEGLAPSVESPPHAAVVSRPAITPAPRACLLQRPEPLRLPETATFTEVPLVQQTKSE